MIRTEWLREGEVFAVRPQGALEDSDFAHVAALVDPVIASRGRLEGLMIDARGFAGWDDTRALLAHLRFVNAHVDRVARIAVVGDQWWLRAAPAMEPFHGTPIRVFDAAQEHEAAAWLLESAPEPAGVTLMPESEGAVVGVRITGRLRDADYKRLQADLMVRLPEGGKLRLLCIVEPGFRGWTPKAFLDDLMMAFSPWRQRFGKLAVVAESGILRWFAVNFPSGLLPCPMKVFDKAETDAAWAWLKE